MKPIKLSIQGLNSFNEEQVIDFNKLTARGFFGVFGPTGSGKSTILDGITLALYGKTSRSSSNFINTQCDSMHICYEFEIRDKELHHYIIDRTYKRNKQGNINASKPTRLVQLVDGEAVVLEDSTTGVDKRCISILGLKFDDFVRTVVLPQGKFSEFLKIEGKPRREMLERLFSLDKYGDRLTIKLNGASRAKKSERDLLLGELNTYEDVDDEIFKEKNETLADLKEENKKLKTESEKANKSYLDADALWQLQELLIVHKNKEKQLNEKKEIIESHQSKIKNGEKANRVMPYLENVEASEKTINNQQHELLKQNELLVQLTREKEDIESEYERIQTTKEIEIPELKVKETYVNQAIEESIEKNKLVDALNSFKKKDALLSIKHDQSKKTLNQLKAQFADVDKQIHDKEILLEDSKVDASYKQALQEGLSLQKDSQNFKKRNDLLDTEIKKDKIEIHKLENQISELNVEIKTVAQLLKEKDQVLAKMIDASPGDTNKILDLQEQLHKKETLVEAGAAYKKDFDEMNLTISQLDIVLESQRTHMNEKELAVQTLKEHIESDIRKNLASDLRTTLVAGEPCPVCGSKTHLHDRTMNRDSKEGLFLEEEKTRLEARQSELDNLKRIFLGKELELKKSMERKDEIVKKLEDLGTDWIGIDITQEKVSFIEKKKAISKWSGEKEFLEKERLLLNDQLSDLKILFGRKQSMLTEKQNFLKKSLDNFTSFSKELDELVKKLEQMKSNLKIDDFIEKNKEIHILDKKRESLEQEIKGFRINLKGIVQEKTDHQEILSETANEMTGIKTEIQGLMKQIEDKLIGIKNKVGEKTDLQGYKLELIKRIDEIEMQNKGLKAQMTAIKKSYEACHQSVKTYEAQIDQSSKRLSAEKKQLFKMISEVQFENIEEVKHFLLEPSELQHLKIEVENYMVEKNQLQGKLQEVMDKMKNRSITRMEWLQSISYKEEQEALYIETKEVLIRLIHVVQILEEKLKKRKKLEKLMTSVNHTLSLLDDLEKVFRGKLFVQFVANYQLKYISMEASRRLSQITNGHYGLEVDEDGKFIIRDYKNGGATRDASTLSGGETFLTSLSLALALSAQIQLKGTAPLELFFLDEGFGTLDDDFLEVVMSSLEKIHSDRLSIGIISHVESIKNRVPIKLMITPAEAGFKGSVLKIENT